MSITAVVVLNYRGADSTKRLLQSLGRLSSADPFKVYVVDNASPDDSFAQLSKYAQELNFKLPGHASAEFQVLQTPDNLGYAAGMNFGLKQAQVDQAEYFWVLTQDLTVEPDSLSHLQRLWSKLDRPGLLGALTDINATEEIYFAGAEVDSKGRTRHPTEGLHIAQVPALRSEEFSRTEYVNGACVFTHRSVLDKVGLIPEVYFMYFEDVEWGLKARAAGFYNYFSHRARIHHHRDSKGFNPVAEYYCRRNSYLFKKRNGFANGLTKFSELSRQCKYLFKSTLRGWLRPDDQQVKQLQLVLSDVVRDIRKEATGKRPSS